MQDKQSVAEHSPNILQVEVTTRCNLNCRFCYNSDPMVQARGTMSFDTFTNLVDQIKPTCQRINLWGTGEPFLHPDLFKMAEYAHACGIPQIKVSTNGHLLTPDNIDQIFRSGITHIRISLESTDPVIYKYFRGGGSVQLVVEGIRRLVRHRSQLHHDLCIILASVVSSTNVKVVGDVAQFAKDLGAKHHIMPNIWTEQFPGLHPDSPSRRCSLPISVLNVLADGSIIPCCHTYRHTVKLGNIHQQGVKNIWNGKRATEIRKNFLNGQFEFCKHCNYGVGLDQT